VIGPRRLTVIVCRGPTCGEQRDSAVLLAHLQRTVAARGLDGQVTLLEETCFGHCLRGPNVLVCDTDQVSGAAMQPGPEAPSAVLYNRMTVEDLDRVVEKHLMGGMVVRPLLNRR
jgi:(2Fe-2S) ferredoxin